MEFFLGFLVVVLIVALVAVLASRKPNTGGFAPTQWRWCAACQAMQMFDNRRCGVCGCVDDDMLRVQIEHCLRGQADATFFQYQGVLDPSASERLTRFYVDALGAAMSNSASMHVPSLTLTRFNRGVQRIAPSRPTVPAPRPAGAPAAIVPAAPEAWREAQTDKIPVAAPPAGEAATETIVTPPQPALPVEPESPAWGQAAAEPLAPSPQEEFARRVRQFARPEAIAPHEIPAAVPLRAPRHLAAEPVNVVPAAERLTRVLLGLGVSGLAIAALIVLTAHDGSYSMGKMLAFAGATAGIFAGGAAFSKWLKLERTAGAFYVLAALFMPLNALAADVFGVIPIIDPVFQWGCVALGCSAVYALCTRLLRSRVFAILSGVAAITAAGFLLQMLTAQGLLIAEVRDGLFALLPLAFTLTCALVMRRHFGQWTLRLPDEESLLALVAGRIMADSGREEAASIQLAWWQVLGMPLLLCAYAAGVTSSIWLLINLGLDGKSALPSIGIAAVFLALFTGVLALGRGLPKINYSTAILLVVSALAWLTYFGDGRHNGAPFLLGIAAILAISELAFTRFKRSEFGAPMLHVGLVVGLAAMAVAATDVPRLEILRSLLRAPALEHSLGSLVAAGGMAAGLFGIWAWRRAGLEWVAPLAVLGLLLLATLGADALALPPESLYAALSAVAACSVGAAFIAKKRELLSVILAWTAVAAGVVVPAIHVLWRALQPAGISDLWMLGPSVFGAAAISLVSAHMIGRREIGVAIGYFLPVGAIAALRSVHVANAPDEFSLALLYVLAGICLSQTQVLLKRLEGKPIGHLAAFSLMVGAMGLVAFGLIRATLELGVARLNPDAPLTINLAFICAAVYALDFALRLKQPALLGAMNFALACIAVTLIHQVELALAWVAFSLALLALLNGAALLAPLRFGWRMSLTVCGTLLASLAGLLALAYAAAEPTQAAPLALAWTLVAGFFVLASWREPALWLSLGGVLATGLAVVTGVHLGAGANLSETIALAACASAVAGCAVIALRASSMEGDTAAARHWRYWSMSSRSLGEVAAAFVGLFAFAAAAGGKFKPELLDVPAYVLGCGALSLGAGALLAARRLEETWRAGQSVLAALFGWTAIAFALRFAGIEAHWLGLAITPVTAGLLAASIALRRRGQEEHGVALMILSGTMLAGAALFACAIRGATDESRALTLVAVALPYLAAWRLAGQDLFAYLGAAALAGAAYFGLCLAGVTGAGLGAGEAAVAVALITAGLLLQSDIRKSPLAHAGLALCGIVTLGLLAMGPEAIKPRELDATLVAALILGAGFSATALLSKVREFNGLMLLYACAAWMLMLRRLEITDLEAYLLGPSLILIGLGIFEAKMRGLLWPESITPNAKMIAGMAVFFAPVLILTLDLNHAWQVGIVFFAATAVIVASVVSKLRVLLWGGLAAALAALMVTLAMVIPFSRMGFGWWIGLGSALLILTGVALERRVNGWLRSNVASARAKFMQAFTGWK